MVAILSPNTVFYPVMVFGTLEAYGALADTSIDLSRRPLSFSFRPAGIVTTMNPSYTAEEIAFQLKDSGAKSALADLIFFFYACSISPPFSFPGICSPCRRSSRW